MKKLDTKTSLTELFAMTQSELKQHCASSLKNSGYIVKEADGYVLAIPKDETPSVCFIAHLDTVYKTPPTEFYTMKFDEALKIGRRSRYVNALGGDLTVENKTINEHYPDGDFLQSPQGIGGDDRCGVYVCMKMAEEKHKPAILLFEDEEIGCVGASKFVKAKEQLSVKFLVEFDRGGCNNVVFYELDNPEFKNDIEDITGYEIQEGTYSDICVIAPYLGVAACNITAGYYNEHKAERELVLIDQVEDTVNVARSLNAHARQLQTPYKYKERYSGWGDIDPYEEMYWELQDRCDELEKRLEQLEQYVLGA